jgi:hypothetical protein
MAKIKKVLQVINKGDYALVYVLTEDGDEATIYCGGEVELFFHKGQIKAFVKRAQSR